LPSPEARDFAQVLIRKAEQDEAVLTRLIEDPGVADESLGFHLQQAVEKRLKAVLALHEVEFDHKHNMTYLTMLLEDEGIELPPCREQIEELTPWASKARYEGLFEGVLDRPVVEGLCSTMDQWSSRLLGETDPFSSTATMLQSFAREAEFDHAVLLVEREEEAFVIHVTVDGSVWTGPVEELGVAVIVQAFNSDVAEDFSPVEREDATTLGDALGVIAVNTREWMTAKQVVLLVRSAADFSFSWWHVTKDGARVADQPANSLSPVLLDLDEIAVGALEPGEFEKPDPDVRFSAGVVHAMSEEEAILLRAQRENFREKFGRDPGPEDPVFFDPEADEPRPLSQEKIDQIASLAEELGATDYAKRGAREKIRSGRVMSIEEAEAPTPFGEVNPVPMILVLIQASTLDGSLEDRCVYAAVHCWAEGHLAAPDHVEAGETDAPLHAPPFPDPEMDADHLAAIVATAVNRVEEGTRRSLPWALLPHWAGRRVVSRATTVRGARSRGQAPRSRGRCEMGG
jgi:HEPN domain-containing protein